MKKNFALVILGLLCAMVVPNAAYGTSVNAHKIKSVTLDPITACQGEEVTATVVVEVYDRSWNAGSKTWWKSTSIDGVCYDHDNHYSSYGTKTFTEVFTFLSPGTQGLGNVQVKTFSDDGCERNKSTVNADLTVIQCGGEDGDSCTVEQGDGFVTITCGDTVAFLYDGENGVDGEDGSDGQDGDDGQDGQDGTDGEAGPQGIPGLSCTVDRDGTCSYIVCEDGARAVVCDGIMGPQGEPGLDGESGRDGEDGADGLNCWDLNGNGEQDACHPQLVDMFDGVCPAAEDFFIDYECEFPPSTSKAMQAAKSYDGECGAVVTCSEYLTTFTAFDSEAIDLICSFTEDTNGDAEFDALDCNGDEGGDGEEGEDGEDGDDGLDGLDGVVGPQGPPGIDGTDGSDGSDGVDGADGDDGSGCEVVDNDDATCTVVCSDSTVLIYNCGVGAEPEVVVTLVVEPEDNTPTNTGMCGSFGGLTVVAMMLPLGLMRFRPRRFRG